MSGGVGPGRAVGAGLLAGRTVVVTGGANGIGRAVAALSAEHGATAVVVLDRAPDPREGATVEALVRDAGAEFAFLGGDVTDVGVLGEMVAEAEKWGGVDLMVCNAGVAVPGDDLGLDDETLDRVVDVNLKGVYRSARAAARAMIDRGTGGSIVITSSMGGIRGGAHTVTYSATKGAARLYAQSLADLLGPYCIRVNAVCPGIIDTGFGGPPTSEGKAAFEAMTARTPLRRQGSAQDVAGAVVWLGSDLSRFVTGSSVVVDGGLTAVI